VPAASFTDANAGDVLTYKATLPDGTALPSWLSFNASTRTFSGTAPTTTVGNINVKVTATDNAGATASDEFVVAVTAENRTLTGTTAADTLTGFSGNDTLSGAAGNDTLIGNAGDDRLDGGAGNDSMTGGVGNDVYVVDSATDATVEVAAGGTDTVEASLSWTLGTELENLTLTGTTAINGTGNAVANVITGNGGANTLSGAAGNDTLIGNAGDDRLDGGAGSDSMTGGVGNDVYVVDATTDATVEAAAGGTDTVEARISWTLGTELENLTLTGTTAINGTGNAVANVITGNSGANTLSGAAGNDTLIGNAGDDRLDGGAGNDSMTGGAGNDVYVVDSATDATVEAAAGGADRVESRINWTLGTEVENLTLTGTTAINGTGNALANVITGNSGANTLSSAAGNDTLNGGAGNDSVDGGAGNDVILFGKGDGQDTLTEATADATAGKLNVLRFKSGVAVSEVTVKKVGTDLEVLIGTGTDKVTVKGFYTGTGPTASTNPLQQIEFADGTVWNLAAIQSRVTGGSTLPVKNLVGTTGADTMFGDTGNNVLDGGTGNDTYFFGAGQGQDQVRDLEWGANTDVLKFLSGVQAEQLWFRNTGNDLEISIIGTTDKVTVRDWYQGEVYWVEQFKTADDRTLNAQNVNALVSAMAGLTPPPLGQTSLSSSQQAALAPAFAANWTLPAVGSSNTNLDTFTTESSMKTASMNKLLSGESAKMSMPDSQSQAMILSSEGGFGDASSATASMPVKNPRPETSTVKNAPFTGTENALLETGPDVLLQTWDLPLGGKGDQAAWNPALLSGKKYLAELSMDTLTQLNAQAPMEASLHSLINAMAAFAPPAAGEVTLGSNEPDGFKQVIAVDWAA
jgi:Ca2+-binding RTX toxin-like protein